MKRLPLLAYFTLFFFPFAFAQADSSSQVMLKRQAANTQAALQALTENEPVEKVINLSFFGTLGNLDNYIVTLYEGLCKVGKQEIISLYPTRKNFPYREQAFQVVTQTNQLIESSHSDTKQALAKSWTYKHFQEHYEKLACILHQADELYRSEDPVDKIEARYIYDSIAGFKHASQRLTNLLLEKAKQEEKIIAALAEKQINPQDINTFDILGITLEMPLTQALAIQPDLNIVEDGRHNSSIFGVKAKLSRKELNDNTVSLETLFSNNAYGAATYELHYNITTNGLRQRVIKKLMSKLMAKYGEPDFDLTEGPNLYEEGAFENRIGEMSPDNPIVFCWGECEKERYSTAFKPGKRFIMTYAQEKEKLSLELSNNDVKIAETNPKDIWENISLDSEKDEENLVF